MMTFDVGGETLYKMINNGAPEGILQRAKGHFIAVKHMHLTEEQPTGIWNVCYSSHVYIYTVYVMHVRMSL